MPSDGNFKILPPDINQRGGGLLCRWRRYPLWTCGDQEYRKPGDQSIVEDRKELESSEIWKILLRLSSRNVLNKRAVENLIKAGALDVLRGTRKQFMSIYIQIVDHVNQEKKNSMVGQMSLFDMVSEEQKEEFQIRMPDVGEYPKENLLAFEKEVLGVYVSGHPLENMKRSGGRSFRDHC